MKKIFFLFLFFLIQVGFSQEISTEIKAKNIIIQFRESSQGGFRWNFPTSESESFPVEWYERKTSLSSKGFYTFIGYSQGKVQATLSFEGEKLQASLSLGRKEYRLKTNAEGFLVINSTDLSKVNCGTCSQGVCGLDHHHNHESSETNNAPLYSALTKKIKPSEVLSDEVLRIYRIAMPVTNEYYTSKFESNINSVRAFWAEMEMGLNELYMRDVSVKFEVVDNEKLIMTDSYDLINAPSYGKVASRIIDNATKNIDNLIGKDTYDVGIVIGKNSELVEQNGRILGGLYGLAGVKGVYLTNYKARAIGLAQVTTLAHEIGHLFGAEHTHASAGVGRSILSEPGEGTSVMSYGSPMDFFSLVSLIENIKPELSNLPYYSDRERTNLVGKKQYSNSNPVYGIQNENKQPEFTQVIKEEYTLPKGTYFQFDIKAKDPENKPLTYGVHQANINQSLKPKFIARKFSTENIVRFQPEFEESRNSRTEWYSVKEHSFPELVSGDFDFWVGVSDADLTPNYTARTYTTTHNVAKTKVKIVNAEPFQLTNSFEKIYKSGDKINLKWNVDSKVFSSDTKVRIMLSDDFGKSFKYTLAESTPNDGEHTITIPENIFIGTIPYTLSFAPNFPINVPAGVIKVEVLEHIAYTLSAVRPFSINVQFSEPKLTIMGGFEILPPDLIFQNLPQERITISCEQRKEIPTLTALVANCENRTPNISYKEEGNQEFCGIYTYKRIWTASDACGNSIQFEQIVEVVPDFKPLVFNEEIPSELTLTCGEPLPIYNLTTANGCENIQISYQVEKDLSELSCDKTHQLTRVWIATDSCNNLVEIKQKVTIIPEVVVYNAVSTQGETNNYFEIQGYTQEFSHLVIFNELGQKVYETNEYHLPENKFRGVSNTGFGIKGKKMVQGTYFYIFTYIQNQNKVHKKGYLYIK